MLRLETSTKNSKAHFQIGNGRKQNLSRNPKAGTFAKSSICLKELSISITTILQNSTWIMCGERTWQLLVLMVYLMYPKPVMFWELQPHLDFRWDCHQCLTIRKQSSWWSKSLQRMFHSMLKSPSTKQMEAMDSAWRTQRSGLWMPSNLLDNVSSISLLALTVMVALFRFYRSSETNTQTLRSLPSA